MADAATPFVPHCERCAFRDAPVVCARCQVIEYCSDVHMQDDTQRHRKGTCRQITDARDALKAEERKLREQPSDGLFLPENVFQQGVGDFWNIHDTRAYMQAKYHLIVTLANAGSYGGIVEALDEARDALRLDEQDHVGVRDAVPAFLLLLGQVQAAYDFIRYWAVLENEDEEDDDEDMDEDSSVAPCFRKTGASMTESLDVFKSVTSAFQLAALMFIKFVMACAINGAIERLRGADEDNVARAEIVGFLEANALPTDVASLESLKTEMETQIVEAFKMADTHNDCMWWPLVMPKMMLKKPIPKSYSEGTADEVRVWLSPYANVLHAFPSSVACVQDMMRRKAKGW